jgi:2,4-dienoyl-CoA reductase-like NADH-dependent reductase (Old Yellow Enzyme family)
VKRVSLSICHFQGITQLAAGGVGLISTGDCSVVPECYLDKVGSANTASSYEGVRIEGYGGLVDAVRSAAPQCRLIAQISADCPGVAPSDGPSPFTTERKSPSRPARSRRSLTVWSMPLRVWKGKGMMARSTDCISCDSCVYDQHLADATWGGN